ncbi:UDP-N-acetylglucosamine 2-epimerase [Magnetococcus marinus MC-1]|uniref:UDP-N-acetylglucosamine 2-epimerase n=1 Tax=Magnetococcus marinus (strain ATCC BAA-1437 / JCM 17883 / MC-1) TaxID=156889 RepID=A0L565_MAGMM|nr:UDP-N-acetylglucosamine 2-epimerase (non-hydrolyzing) [Magnetococcus marinus]ABK43108.1 UDP-N-acetylglucosamine 2-epimerase [Magnetococcus marinus MC-1]
MGEDKPIVCVVGARPNFMKMAAVLPALGAGAQPVPTLLVHTGQHYDAAMKQAFFEQLSIPEPQVDLGVGSGSHAVQTGLVMQRFEPVLDHYGAAAVLVVGDVNSTIATALVAVKKGIPVIHVEAGLRSQDRSMPEEINRILTDQIADFLFTTERQAEANLKREGIAADKIHFVGNVMIDTLRRLLPQAATVEALAQRFSLPEGVSLAAGGYGLLTLHRPANVDDPQVLAELLQAVCAISHELPLLFPVHPRTLARVQAAGLQGLLESAPQLVTLPPVGYLEMLGLMSRARVVLTDSGGIQEETTALGIPCMTLRENTERPITVSHGTNTLVGRDGDKLRTTFAQIMQNGGKAGRIPELWDGQAAPRIAQQLQQWYHRQG